MQTFIRQAGRLRYQCLLSEREFKTDLEARQFQESLIRRLQALELLGGDYSFGELHAAYHQGRTAAQAA